MKEVKHHPDCPVCLKLQKNISVNGSTFNEIKTSTGLKSPLISYHLHYVNLLKVGGKYYLPSTTTKIPSIIFSQVTSVIVNKNTLTVYNNMKIHNTTKFSKPYRHTIDASSDTPASWADLNPRIQVNKRVLYDKSKPPKFLKKPNEYFREFNINRIIPPKKTLQISFSFTYDTSNPEHKYYTIGTWYDLESWDFKIHFNTKPLFKKFYKIIHGIREPLNMHVSSSGDEFYTKLRKILPTRIYAIYSKEAFTAFSKRLI